MILEEALLNYQDHFGTDQEFYLKTKKLFGHVQIIVSLAGERFDPFVVG